MSLLLSRMMTSFTLAFALVVGVAGVRLVTSENTEITVDSSYLSLFESPAMAQAETVAVEAPEMNFEEIQMPLVSKKIIARKAAPKKDVVVSPTVLNIPKVSHNELSFEEPVKLHAVAYKGELLTNMVALYQGLPVEEKVLVAEEKKVEINDEVKTAQAAPVSNAEPEFFEYEAKEPEKADLVEVNVAEAAVPVKEKITKNVKVEVSNITAEPPAPIADVKPEVGDAALVAFDYSGLKQDIQDKKVPTVTQVSSHHKKGKTINLPQEEKASAINKNALIAPSYESQMTIQGVATNLKQNETLRGFEVRFQDNSAEIVEDYGDGEVTVTASLARPKMTRSIVLLKRGFVPTNTDLIIEEGAGSVSIPVLTQELMDELMEPHEKTGAVGALLVELADETEKATLDVPFGKVITLDGDMRETSSDDFRYQLFIGVKAGNALLSYVHENQVTHKIIHVHDREMTYESNFFEKNNLGRIGLWQEDLLSREKSPLITASENVKVFAKDTHGEKLNQNTYRIDFGKALLGGRNYLELTHERESVFVGTKSESELVIPSENFMRHILGSLPESKLGNRCVIQVNVKKKVSEVLVGAESVDLSLMTNVQFLDADGRFYDSASEKTRKVIVFGENQGSDLQELSGKVNVKISYLDGTVDYLGSYCSPNTYLVEQL
jgi:hypothetical protein